MIRLGESGYTVDPNEEAENAKKREAQADKMNYLDKTYISFIQGGTEYRMLYRDFLAKYGDPKQYKPEDIIKKVMKHHLGF